MKGQRSRLLKGAGWVSLGNLAGNLLGVVSLLVLTRLLMPEDFGLIAIATAFTQIVGVLTELSLATALIQRNTVSPAHYHTAWTMNVIRGALVGGLLAIASPFVAQFYGDDRLALVIQVVALSTVISASASPKMVIFQRELDFGKSVIVNICGKLGSFVAAVAIALIYQSYLALIAGTLATAIVSVTASYILQPYRPRFTLAAWRDLLSFSIWLTLGRWVQAITWRSQPLLFGYILPTQLVGQLNVGSKLVGLATEQSISPIQRILFPAFSRLQNDKERLRVGYMRSQGTICLISFPFAVGLAVLAEEIVAFALGEKWLPSAPLIAILVIPSMIRSIQNVNALALATANTKALFFRDLRLFCIRWPLIVTGIILGGDQPFDMLIGALYGQIVAAAINSFWNMRLIARISPISMGDHASFVWRPLLSSAAMGLIVWLALGLWPEPNGPLHEAIQLVLLIALGAASYLASLFVIWNLIGRGDTIETEITSIIRTLFAKFIDKARAVVRPQT